MQINVRKMALEQNLYNGISYKREANETPTDLPINNHWDLKKT